MQDRPDVAETVAGGAELPHHDQPALFELVRQPATADGPVAVRRVAADSLAALALLGQRGPGLGAVTGQGAYPVITDTAPCISSARIGRTMHVSMFIK